MTIATRTVPIVAPRLATRRAALLAIGAASAAPLVLAHAPRALAQTGDEYVALTMEAGLFTKTAAEIALERGEAAAVKTFAELEIGEVTAIETVLKSTGVPAPTELDGEEVGLIDRLRELSGAEFDAAFVDAQLAGHREALRIQQPMSGMDEITVPVATAKLAEESIKSHIATLEMIRGMLG